MTTVILVRHAEREPTPVGDPPLSAAGQIRAISLIEAAGQADVSAIYHTRFQRTRQTARPLADYLGIATIQLNWGDDHEQQARDLVRVILSQDEGKTVVVVGHSNTIPLIIQSLGINPPPLLDDSEFDRIFVVVKQSGGRPRLIQGRYGPANAAQ